MKVKFCLHGNVIGLRCTHCSPTPGSDSELNKGIDCLVFGILERNGDWNFRFDHPDITREQIGDFVSCANEGVIIRSHSTRQESVECTSCGWMWIRWKGSGDLAKNGPKLVKCNSCKKITVELSTRTSSYTCSQCGREWMREKKPTYFDR
jgi:predicted RNA-binding Zn-ribbon protein involved in translation (DUF1610 family)